MEDCLGTNTVRLRLLTAFVLASALMSLTARGTERRAHVSYVSASTVYVDAGRADGLMVGDQLRVVRDGELLAVIEVAWVAEHSASCTVVSETRGVSSGDLVVLIARDPQSSESPSEVPTLPAEPEVPEVAPTVLTVGLDPSNDAYGLVGNLGSTQPWAKVSGSITVLFQSFEDGVTGRGFDESTGRISLRLREIDGRPLEMRARLRSRQIRRDTAAGRNTAAGSETDDRLYELSLTYDPPDGAFSFQVGRLGASPFFSLGYLDGILAQYRFTEKIAVGGFYGSRPEIEELGFDSAGQKYGSFLRWRHRPEDSTFHAEVVVAGIGEYLGGEVDREYVSIESRFGSRRWSFSQLAEIDLNSGWRKDLAGQSQQISNLSFSGWFRPQESLRLSLSYDRRQRYRTLDTRPIPEERFDDKLREGLRFGVHVGKPRGLNGSATVGYRAREGDEGTLSFAGSLYHTGIGQGKWLIGGDFSGYQGDTTDGYMVTLRTRRLIGRHDIGLVVGASTTMVASLQEERRNQWARLTTTIQLPRRFFLRAEIEYDVGDDLEGQRLIVELGRRF
jgi:hypothetical protein